MEQEIKAENRVPCSERDCRGLKPEKVGKRQVAVQRALGKARVCEEEEKTLEIPKSYGMTLQEKKEILKKGGGGGTMASQVAKRRRNKKSEKT